MKGPFVEGNAYAVGARVTYSCKDKRSFKLEGASSITCEKDGMWSDVVPRCKPVYFPEKDNSFGRKGESGMNDDTWWSRQMRGYDHARNRGHFDDQGLNGATGINFVEAEIH